MTDGDKSLNDQVGLSLKLYIAVISVDHVLGKELGKVFNR